MYRIEIIEPIQKFSNFNIRRKGLQLIERDDSLLIYSDPFCSHPLYINSNKKSLILFQNFPTFLNKKEESFNSEIDPVAFYETILYGTPLWSRTIFKSINQLPAASVININKNSGEYTIERYWNFEIEKNISIKNLDDAAYKLNEHLLKNYDSLDKNQHYLMGLSGGMDSRLSLAYLSTVVPKESISLFTFGFNPKILEYSYAKLTAEALGFKDVDFHQLDCHHYRDALDYLPKSSLGQISVNHCHISSFLKSLDKPKNTIHLSNYYSDALFGYATHLPKVKLDKDQDAYSIKLNNAKFIDQKIKEEIKNDIAILLSGYNHDYNFSSKNEYIYITERNPKFHLNLANCQSNFMQTIRPFADFDLLNFTLSIPLEYREQKIILDKIFDKFFPLISRNNINQISSRFSSRFASNIDWPLFKILNATNGLMRKFSNGKLQILNKFHTEEQDRLLYTCFNKHLLDATQKFYELGLIDSSTKKYFDKIPIRAIGNDQRFTLISLSGLLSDIHK